MKRFWKNSFLIIISGLALSCVRSDYQFGNDMLDGGKKMETHIDTFYMTKTYQCMADSFPTSVSGVCTIGRWHSDSVGTCYSSCVTNYVPMGFSNDDLFGEGAEVDSLTLTMNLINTRGWGDSTQSMRIKIYRISGITFNADTTYYSNFPIEKYIDPTPMVTATTREYGKDTDMMVVFPEWYAKLHLDNRLDTGNIYIRDEKFINQINGLYVTAEPVNPTDNRLIDWGISASSMRLHYHNDTYPDSALYQSYILYNTSLTSYASNFQITRTDVTTAKPEIGGIDYRMINDTMTPQKRVYVSCPQEIYPRIDFDTAQIRSLWTKAKEAGYKYIGLQKAELRLKLPNSDYKTLDKTITPLKLYVSLEKPKFLTEYNPLITSTSSSSAYNTIGGDLVRSGGYYSFNITGYMQRMLNRAQSTLHLDVFPVYTSGLGWGTSYIGGSEDPDYKPELIVTYTFLEKL